MMQISIGNMKKRSILKLIFFSALTLYLPFALIIGGLAVAGYDTVTFNDENVYGVTAILVAIVLSFVFAGLIAVFLTLGAWILAMVAPNSVAIKSKNEEPEVGKVFE